MLISLWLPILLSAVALFFGSFLSWMVIQLHKSDWPKHPKEDELLDALRSLRLLEPVGPGPEGREVWLIHAGLHPEWRDLPETAERLQRGANKDSWLDAPDTEFATLVRHCTPEGRLCGALPDGRPEDRRALPWDTFYDGAAWIVHGHWAQRGAYRGRRTIGLDSGCVYGQELTAWTPDEDRWVRVPSRQPRR